MKSYSISRFYVTADKETGFPVKHRDVSGEFTDWDGFLRPGSEDDLVALFNGTLGRNVELFVEATDDAVDCTEVKRDDRRRAPRKFRRSYYRIVVE